MQSLVRSLKFYTTDFLKLNFLIVDRPHQGDDVQVPTVKTDDDYAVQAAVVAAEIEEAREHLLRLRLIHTRYLLVVAEKVVALKDKVTEHGLKVDPVALLTAEAGFSTADAKLFAMFDADLATSKILMRHASADTVKALAGSDGATRRVCLARMERGDRVDARHVQRVRRANSHAEMSASALAASRRKKVFAWAAREVGATVRTSMEHGADELLQLMRTTASEPQSQNSSESLEWSALRTKASEVLDNVVRLFGEDRPLGKFDGQANDVVWASLEHARATLKALQIGVDQTDENALPADGPSSLQWGLEFLSGKRAFAVSNWAALDRYKQAAEPTLVDVDAGVGSAALGLAAAGFLPVQLFTNTSNERNAISSNHMSWKIRKIPRDKDTKRVIRAEFDAKVRDLQGTEIDLVTSGIPWHTYKNEGAQDAFENAVTAVEQLHPKAFFFEVLKKEFDGSKADRFKKLGYDFEWYTIDGADFGIAQTKKRHVIVGRREGMSWGHSMPLVKTRRRTLRAAISDLVGGHVWKGDETEEQLQLHANSVKAWLDACPNEPAPRFPNPSEPGAPSLWKTLGIDVKRYVKKPPETKHFARKDGFMLSTEMVKRIQGIPTFWNIDSTYATTPVIAQAFPPLMAKMVGLSIHSALRGIEIDYERALVAALLVKRKLIKSDPDREYAVPKVTRFIKGPNFWKEVVEPMKRKRNFNSIWPGAHLKEAARLQNRVPSR